MMLFVTLLSLSAAPQTAVVLAGSDGLQTQEVETIVTELSERLAPAWPVSESLKKLGEKSVKLCRADATCLRGLASVAKVERLVVVEVTRVGRDRAWLIDAIAVGSGERLARLEWVDRQKDPFSARLGPLVDVLTPKPAPADAPVVTNLEPVQVAPPSVVAPPPAASPSPARVAVFVGAGVAAAAAVGLLLGSALVGSRADARMTGANGLMLSPLTYSEAQSALGTSAGLGVGGGVAAAAALGLAAAGLFAF